MTIDLTENKIPFGLLSKEEQEHLENWPHGLRVLGSSIVGRPIWERADLTSKLNTSSVYRTIPAPVEPERESRWLYCGGTDSFHTFRIEFDAGTGDNPTIAKETLDE